MKNVDDILPLAPLQQLMLAHALADVQGERLVERFQCTLQGPLDVALFQRAWQAVAQRHPLLRASCAWQGLKRPVQVIRKQVPLDCQVHDWRDAQLSEEQHRRKDALLADDRHRGIDPARPPLWHWHLARLTDDRWWFLWTCHHLLLDGWSVGVVLRDVFTNYAALRRGETPSQIAERGFRDYLAWLEAQDRSAADAQWRDYLQDCPPPIALPLATTSERTTDAAAPRGEVEYVLAAEPTRRLSEFASRQRISLNTLIEAAWGVLLTRYAEQQELIFGVAVSGRPPQLPGMETAVGPFVNNIPRRIRVQRDQPVAELLSQLHGDAVEMQAVEYCTLDSIARAAALPDGYPLFETLVVCENYPLGGGETRVGDLTIRDVHGTATSTQSLALIAMPGQSLALRLSYDANQFVARVAERLLQQYVTLLCGLPEAVTDPVDALPLVADHAWEQQKAMYKRFPQRVLDAAGRPLPIGMPGEIWTPIVASSSREKEAAEAREVVDPYGFSGRLRPTAYRGRLTAEGEIEPLGPVNGSVGSDAWRVDPEEVRAVLALHPLVQEAAVVRRDDRFGRPQLTAFVVAEAGAESVLESRQHGLLIGQLQRFLAQRLPEPMVPRVWRALDALPQLPSGEIDSAALPAAMRPRGEVSQRYVAPRDDLETRLATIWSELLCVEPIGVDDNFFELGGYSSLAVALLARLEREFDRRLPLSLLFEVPTVAHLAAALRREPGSSGESLAVPLRSGGKQAPLFCVHPAGGTVFCYLELAKRLDAEIPVIGLQAQGLDADAPQHESLEEMAAAYVSAISSLQPAGPYRLCGWSTGGVIAFEVARQLAERGDEVALLALLDAGIPREGETFDERDIAAQLQLMFPGEDPAGLRRLQELSTEEQLAAFQQRAEAAQLLLTGTGVPQARRIYEVFQANMKAVVGYRPRPYSGHMVLVRAAQHATPMHADPVLGWGSWVSGVEVQGVPSSHLELLQPPAVERVAAILARRLATDVPASVSSRRSAGPTEGTSRSPG